MKCPLCEHEHQAFGHGIRPVKGLGGVHEGLFETCNCDYEACGDCGYDHQYDHIAAQDWHERNDEEET